MSAASVPFATTEVLLVSTLALAGGLVIGWWGTHRSRRDVRRTAALSLLDGPGLLLHELAVGAPASGVLTGIVSLSATRLGDLSVRVVDEGLERLPSVARRYGGPDGLSPDAAVVLVPRGGAVVHFSDPRLRSGIVVAPQEGTGTLEVPRSDLLALADHVEQFVRTTRFVGR